LGFLSLISAFNYTDPSILALALPAIKAQMMHLSDTVLGLVYGSAFAIFYAIFRIPVAWLADHGNRRLAHLPVDPGGLGVHGSCQRRLDFRVNRPV
jgi:hypothetical protein